MTSSKMKLKATTRTILGRKVKNLKNDGLIAANIFGASGSEAISLSLKEVMGIFAEAGESQVVYIQIDDKGKEKPVLFDEIQVSPVNGDWIHVALREVNLKEKVEAAVPVVLVGENKVPETVVVLVHDEIEVEALPTDLPKEFSINIEEKLTEVDASVTFAELDYDREKVTLKIEEEEIDTPVVVLQAVKEEVEEEPVAEEGAEGETGEVAVEGGEEKSEEAAD